MSELDVALQQETGDVSLTEMMNEADTLISLDNSTINNHSKGDDANGK